MCKNIADYYEKTGNFKESLEYFKKFHGKSSDFSNIFNMIQISDKELYRAKNMGRNITFLNNLIK